MHKVLKNFPKYLYIKNYLNINKKSLYLIVFILLIISLLFDYSFTPTEAFGNTLGFSQKIFIYFLRIFIFLTSYFFFLYIFKKQDKIIKKLTLITSNNKLILIFSLLYFILFLGIVYKKHLNLEHSLYDFGIQLQVIWNTSLGRFFASGVETSNYLGDHFSPILILPAIVYKIIPSYLSVLAFQIICLLIGGYGIYFLSLKVIKSKTISLIIFFIFCFYPPLSGILLFDFHEISIVIPFLVWGIYFYDSKKYFNLSLLLFIIASFTKEDVGIFIGSFGLYKFYSKKDIKGLILFIYGYLFSIITILILIPYIRGSRSHTLSLRYSEWGDNFSDITRNILIHPVNVFKYIFTKTKLKYILKLLTPLGLTPLFSGFCLLVILPNILINVLSNSPHQINGYAHYDVMTSIGIFYCAIIGIDNIIKYVKLKTPQFKFKIFFKPFLLSLFLLTTLANPFSREIIKPIERYKDYLMLDKIKQTIPSNSSVATSNSIGGYFAEREKLQIFYPNWSNYSQLTDYIIIDKKEDYDEGTIKKISSISSKYSILINNESFEVLKKLIFNN